jgi:hypothetical protein
MFINDKKNELINRINILLVKFPEWKEYLDPVLEELTLNNVSIMYINEKLADIKQLESDDNSINYKEQVNNLCLFLKSELESGNILLNKDSMIILTNLVNDTLYSIECKQDIDWEKQLNTINIVCNELYK